MNKLGIQKIAANVFSAFNVNNPLFAILNTSDTIAGALGIYTDIEFPLFGLKGTSVVGFIYVDEKYHDNFTDAEWTFIIAHECSHIFRNHVLGTAFWKITETILRGPDDENKALVGGVKLLLALLSPERLPPDAITLKNQEYEADERAVRYTGDLHTAVGCLNKLASGQLGVLAFVGFNRGQVASDDY